MSVQAEELEKDMAKLIVELNAEQFEDAVKKAFSESKNKFNIPDFRKGKAPRTMIEEMYDENAFYEETADEVINAIYMGTVNEDGLETVSRPEVAVKQIGRDKPLTRTVTAAVRPRVTLGEYKGIEVKKADVVVKPEDAKAELKKIQEQNARLLTVEDRPTADGDQAVIDFEGFVNDKIFDGGKAASYPLIVGSHSFTGILRGQLVGKNISEKYEISVTFPEEYHAAESVGKPAAFKVTVKEVKVKELPELGDEFTGEVSKLDTLDEYKKDTEAKIPEGKRREAIPGSENRVIDRVVAGASMEIPDRMVEGQIDNMVQDIARRMESQDLNIDLYMKYIGMIMEQTREQVKPQVSKRIWARLVFEEVVKAENLRVSDERLDEEIVEMAAAYQMETDKLEGYMPDRDKNQMKEDIAVQKAVDFLVVETKLV